MKKLILAFLLCISSSKLMCMEPLGKKEAITAQDITTCLQACRSGNISAVQAMHKKGVKLDKPLNPPFVEYGYEGSTFLHWAVCQPDVVAFLLKYIPAHVADDEQHTPLAEAVCHLQPRTVALLLEHGANPAFTDFSLNSSLHEVTRGAGQGFLGINLNVQEKSRRTCAIIQMLKARKAPLFLQNKTMDTPLHLAAATKDPAMILSLLMPEHTEEQKVALKKEARDRVRTFLLCLKRNQWVLPLDVKRLLFRYLIDDIHHGDMQQLLVPKPFNPIQFSIKYLRQIMNAQDLAMLQQTLETPNIRQLTPMQLATDPQVKALLNPETWS